MTLLSRRRFSALLLPAMLCFRASEAATIEPHRALRFRIGSGFGEGLNDEIQAVLQSAADMIWQHCPQTHWQVPGFYIYFNEAYPITNFEHTADGCIAIGLATKGTYWCQYAFQFAHEFCHALTGHANDWTKQSRGGDRPNHWLEEVICEVASLFSLRAMARKWKEDPPFVNWKDFAEKLSEYAEERITKTREQFKDPFLPWFQKSEAELRKNATMREQNCRIAIELLPIFEKAPAGWEAMTSFKGPKPSPDQTLTEHFQQWHERVDQKLQPFVKSIATVFGVGISS